VWNEENDTGSGSDWRVESTPQSLTAFQAVASSMTYQGRLP
jgi:hypothetical protein